MLSKNRRRATVGAALTPVAGAVLFLTACGGEPRTVGDAAIERAAKSSSAEQVTSSTPGDLHVEVVRVQRKDPNTDYFYIRKVKIEGQCYLQPMKGRNFKDMGALTPVACGRDQ